MQYVIIVVLLAGLLYAALQLKKRNAEMKELQKKLSDLKEYINENQAEAEGFESKREELWNYANTIHLYTNISYEEAKTKILKENLSEILNNINKMMQIIKK